MKPKMIAAKKYKKLKRRGPVMSKTNGKRQKPTTVLADKKETGNAASPPIIKTLNKTTSSRFVLNRIRIMRSANLLILLLVLIVLP